jgi:hypothetical protein
VAVPTDLLGLELAWQRHERLPWPRLVLPSSSLARSGFAAHPYLVYLMLGPFMRQLIMNNSALRESFLVPEEGGGWRLPEVGELCCWRPLLADTLEVGWARALGAVRELAGRCCCCWRRGQTDAACVAMCARQPPPDWEAGPARTGPARSRCSQLPAAPLNAAALAAANQTAT